jgi:hypothetical protein
MVPHGAGEQRGREAAVDAAAEIRRRFSSFAIDAMALDATLTFEELFSLLGISGYDRQRGGLRTEQDKTRYHGLSEHVPDHVQYTEAFVPPTRGAAVACFQRISAPRLHFQFD